MFLACLDEKATRLVLQGETATQFSSDLQHDLLVFSSQHESFKLLTAEKIHDMTTEVSVYRRYSQPFFILSGMKNSSCQELFALQSEEEFKHLMSTLRPGGQEVARLLEPDYDVNDSRRLWKKMSLTYWCTM